MTAPSIIDQTESFYQDDWTRANQRYLTAHLGRLRALLRSYCEQGSQPDGVTSSAHARGAGTVHDPCTACRPGPGVRAFRPFAV